MSFEDCWERVKQATKLRKQTQLADFLNISSSNISEAKVKGRFPLHWAFKIAQEFKISTDWILTGQGPMVIAPDWDKTDDTLKDDDQFHKALDYVLLKGSTYQRGVIKGYLNELAAEIAAQIDKDKES